MDFLLEYGPLGAMVVFAGSIIVVLWKYILKLQKEFRDEVDQSRKRQDQLTEHYRKQLLDLFNRYETMVREIIAQNKTLESTLKDLQEGLGAKELFTEYVRNLGKDRR